MMIFALYVGICITGTEPMNISARDCITRWERIEAYTSLADCTAGREMRQKQWDPKGRGPMVCRREEP